MRPINKRLATLEQGAAGEVRILSRQWFDLPRSAFKIPNSFTAS